VSPRRLLGAALALSVSACIGGVLEPLPFKVDIAANRLTAAPGDTVIFAVTAQGGNLLGVEIDYADGNGDSYNTAGARTATVGFKHVYQAPGSFQVEATVTDQPAGIKSATIQIVVN
jgi:hypothetical protein